jgi:hypothetical protein
MTAINIQCRPTPLLWVSAGAVLPLRLADEASRILVDEAGNQLEPDRGQPIALQNNVQDENQNLVNDEQNRQLYHD